jgi:hypothetical protein
MWKLGCARATFTVRASFGNLIARWFEEIWNDEPYSTFRKKMDLGILPYQCQHCPKYAGKQDDS